MINLVEKLDRLRDRNLELPHFREISDHIANELLTRFLFRIFGVFNKLPTPIIILRAGLVFQSSIMKLMPTVKIGMLGIRRDEITATPSTYSIKIPDLCNDQAFVILDPMLATGGSAVMAVDLLRNQYSMKFRKPLNCKNVFFCGFVAAPEGVSNLTGRIPKENIHYISLDAGLDSKKFIIPGLGDFGDRYFGT